MATFLALGGLPWYFKIAAGLLSDSVPIWGTRRRHYLLVSAVLAAVLWIVIGQVPRTFLSLLLAVIATNTMLVVGSTVVGALLVEAEQQLGAGAGWSPFACSSTASAPFLPARSRACLPAFRLRSRPRSAP